MAARRFNWPSWPGKHKNETTKAYDEDISTVEATDAQWVDVASGTTDGRDEHVGAHAGPRWLSELQSPYGRADEDGTLKQVESVNWQNVARLSTRGKKRFVPRTAKSGSESTNHRWQTERDVAATDSSRSTDKGINSKTKATGSAGSTWMLQLGAAAVLTLVAVYAHNGSTPLAGEIRTVYQHAFGTDYTQTAAPAISHFLKAHNLSVPAFLTESGAVKLHVPLQGKIVQDYSSTHPQMTIVGTPGESVLSVGSGTVTRVVALSSGSMVVIDHGTLGTSYYFGLQSTAVRKGESVASGQVIGKLPDTSAPKLMFELEHGGKAVNPHDYIVFPASAGKA